ncbi:MAG TPA: serine hydrolase domain-containing protein [Micromonosporaceae bacterium]
MRSLRDLLAEGLSAQPRPWYPGAVALILRDGRVLHHAAIGDAVRYADRAGTLLPDVDREPVRPDTVFDLASLTKLFTTTVVLTLVDQGTLSLDQPLAEWLPSYRDGHRRAVTLRHLLTHTSGLPALLSLWTDWPDRDARADAVREAPLVHPPGSVFEYSCVGYILAGLLVEQVTGRSLPDLVRERVCEPLGLRDTGYLPGPELVARCAATEHQPDTGRGMVRGSVHDENSWSLGGVAGNAGVFGTAADVARFGEMLRRRGTLDGVRVLREDTVAEMTRDQLPPDLDPGYRHGLGVRVADPQFMGPLAAHGAFGHTGFTGTCLVVDPVRGLVVVLLTNRVHPSRDWSDLAPVRRRVAEFAVQAADAAAHRS